jgi:pimeloyl-ACP methyl ester carboxylesterase
MPFLKHNKGDIYYSIVGEGEPIVFIHGFGLDSRMWKPQVQQLSTNHKVITYDLRGFGKSSLPENKYSHVDDLRALLQHLQISNTKLVGHSFGGEIAIQFILKYLDIVKRLVLISSSLSGYSFENSTWEELRELGRKDNLSEIRSQMLNHKMVQELNENSEAKELVATMLREYSCWHFLNKDLREEVDSNSINRLRDINIPVNIIVGGGDSEAQKEIAQLMDSKIPKSTLTVIENAGHMVNLQKPEEVSKTVISEDVV